MLRRLILILFFRCKHRYALKYNIQWDEMVEVCIKCGHPKEGK